MSPSLFLILGVFSAVLAVASGSALRPQAQPAFQATQCGGALTEYTQGGIFYKFNEEVDSDREQCIWTVTPGNSSFNGIRFTLVSEDFAEDNVLVIAYATPQGKIVELKSFEHGDLSSVDVPSSVAFVIFSTEYSNRGKGFILYYEGINQDTILEPIPAGSRTHFTDVTGVHSTSYAEKDFSVFVFPGAHADSDYYTYVQLIVRDFNYASNSGMEDSHLDDLIVWGVQRETPNSKQKLLIQPLVTISGSSKILGGSRSTIIKPEASQALIAILKGGHPAGSYSSAKLTLEWKSTLN